MQSKKLVIMCGSGVSSSPPSNLPLARELQEHILDKILGLQTCQRFVAKFKKVPLEAVIEVVERNSPQFLQALSLLLTSVQPNVDHYFMAALMAKGYLHTIMTTNFDTLLEKALSLQNLSFKVFSREEEFGDLDLTDLLSASVIKIHGTADDLTSIRSTLRLVAMPLRSDARRRALSLFFEGLQKDVLILGYGATDEFDINPVLRSLKTTARIYQIHHSSENIFETQNLDDPFAGLRGVKVTCNTQQLLGALSSRLLGETHPIANDISAWRSIIDDWAIRLDVGVRQFVASDLMELIGQLGEAREYLEDCLGSWSQVDEKRMRALLNLGNLEENMAMFPEAEVHFKECFSIAAKLGNDSMKAMSLQHLGQLAYQRRDLPSAMILTRQSQDLFQKALDAAFAGVSASLHQIGMIYTDMGLSVKAEWRLRESLKISRDLGDIEGEARSLAQLGLLYKAQRKSPEAITSFKDARSLFFRLGREDMVTRMDSELKQIEERHGSPSSNSHEQVTELSARDLPIEKHYCRVSPRELDNPPRIRYIFQNGIRLRNKSGRELHIEYTEAISESITFSNGQTFTNRKPNRKEAFGHSLPPNGLLELEWDETHETDRTKAKPAFVRYRVLVRLKEKSDPIELVLNISSPELRF